MEPFPWRVARPLTRAQRACVAARLSALLRWQRDLRRWAAPGGGGCPNGTPFVSLYARGRLTGCFGSNEGSAAERLTRAFLRALEDARFGAVSRSERDELAAQVSYPVARRRVRPERVLAELEVGVHGVALAPPGAQTIVLLPHVARDAGLGPLAFLEAAAQKAGLAKDGWRDATVTLFETEDVVTRLRAATAGNDPRARAARWLARLVARDGAVTFAVDARKRETHRLGPMHHGRAAVVVAALAGSTTAGARTAAARARARLVRDLRAGLAGQPVAGFPDHPAVVAGTCALACLAGAGLERELAQWVDQRPEVRQNLWHCGQVALALGEQAPAALWQATVADLERAPWAPWTLMAARTRGDGAIVARCERVVVASIRATGPHVGGASVTPVPELALTALAAESLAQSRSRAAARAVERARQFLLRWQHGPSARAALAHELVDGAFPASPVLDLARGDVTGHALLALGPA